MAKSRSRGWWRSGSLPSRLLWLGAISGLAAAVAFNANYMIGHVNAATLMWGMANLFIFEIPTGVMLGFVVVLIVLMVRTLVPTTASKMLRSAVIGAVALLCGGVLISSVLHDVPVPGGAGAVGWIAGTVVGIAFTVVSYRHPAAAGVQAPLVLPTTSTDNDVVWTGMSNRDSRHFMRDLIVEHPYLRSSYEEHLKDNDGDLLPHLLIADICRWVVAEQDSQPLRVLQLLSWLEVHFAGQSDAKDDVDNAIAVSFIEHLPLPSEPGADVLLLLGPKMKTQYEQFHS
ncbi:hypothetical protein ACIPY0_14875 [Paenarthrobacter nicotinovorans]|uniref:DUF7674 family protein n=1 Tax=Paenarthrobacter nicotinovorans TaxID=29320 RepID=UPI0038295A0A